MGSSRKHKERTKSQDRRESRKRHHRSRSKEHGPSSSGGGGGSRRDNTSSKRRRDEYPTSEKAAIKLKEDQRNDDEPVACKGGSGGDLSLSISETNKLRIKLGLKPLDVSDGSSSSAAPVGAGGIKSEGGEEKKDFVHKPAENLTNKRFIEKLREKVSVQKQKRMITDKLSKVKTLAESDSEDDAVAWVSKSRSIEVEKRKAEERAKLLAEMDEEFGVGNLVEDEFKQIKDQAYSSKDLLGLKVEHEKTSFQEGKLTILTLQDRGVLDESDDTLINVNLLDDEKAAKNVVLRKNKPTYNPYEGEEVDEFGQVKDKSLLAKYDEEIEGEKKTSFTIGASGKVSSERELIKQKLLQKQGVVSLELPLPKVASEYYTDEEMVKFKKPKKKVSKVRRKVRVLKADDLLQMCPDDGSSSTSDLGSRNKPKVENVGRNEKSKHRLPMTDIDMMDIDEQQLQQDDYDGPDEDLSGQVIDHDEAELELQLALSKARKLKSIEDKKPALNRTVDVNRIRDNVEAMEGGEQSSSAREKGFIVLNSTAEFCRALGDIPTYGLSGNRDEDVQDLRDFDEDFYSDRRIKEEPDGGIEDERLGSWNEVSMTSPTVKVKKEEVTILDEEPDVGSGIAGALQLAMKKGYLEKEMKKMVSAPRHSTLEAASYTIEDKNMLEDDRLGRRERYTAGPVTDFRDKDGYKPDIKLEYIDDGGRLLSPKEAFRYLSHKFHGKGSGKNKTEKRMKKLQEESLMKRMSSTDTPLGTLALLQDKQKQTQSPYIILSGGSKAINSSVISKTK